MGRRGEWRAAGARARGSPATTTTTRRSADSFTDDGWLRTGDVATIDAEGYIRLVDRTKDLIKSGGEWISSVELENELMAHPKIAEAAVIGVPHPKWTERPLACVVVKPGEELTEDEVLEFLDAEVAKWRLPDDVVFIDEVPKTVGRQVLEEDAARPLRRLSVAGRLIDRQDHCIRVDLGLGLTENNTMRSGLRADDAARALRRIGVARVVAVPFDELLAAAKAREPWALERLYRAHAGAIAGYLEAEKASTTSHSRTK